jgi:hypothetical protein
VSFSENGALFLKGLSQKVEIVTELVRHLIQGTTMKPEFLEARNMLDEGPKCGKHSLAQQGHDKYHCLGCGFYRDISQPEGRGLLLVATIFAVVLIVSLANQTRSQTDYLDSPDSSNVPALELSPVQK